MGLGVLEFDSAYASAWVWMGHRQWPYCSHTGDWSFRALQVQTVIFRPCKPVAHPICIKQARELHAGPLYCVQLWKQSHTLALKSTSPLLSTKLCSSLPAGMLCVSCRNVPSILSLVFLLLQWQVFPSCPFNEHCFCRTCSPGILLGNAQNIA